MSKKKPNEYYRYLYEHADEIVSKERVDELEKRAIQLIKEVCPKYKNVCVGYSAGKESLVVLLLMQKSLCQHTPVIWQTIFQWTSVMKWLEANKPAGLVTVTIERPSWKDLEEKPSLLFPSTPDDNNWWMSKKWIAQKRYFKENGVDLFVTGRRIGDGNNCGKKENNYVRNAKLYDVFSPVSEWSEEELFAYMIYNGLKLPPNYETLNGFLQGSGAWAERMCYGNTAATVKEQWDIVYQEDANIVIEASKYLTAARQYLEERSKQN